MGRSKQPRSEAQKAQRKVNDRLVTLRIKVGELNDIKENKAIVIWTEKEKTLAYGDQKLLESLGYTGQLYPKEVRRPKRARHPTLSPTSSASSATSLNSPPQHGQNSFEDEDMYGLGFLQEEPVLAASGNGIGLNLRCRKEDLDLLAMDLFNYN